MATRIGATPYLIGQHEVLVNTCVRSAAKAYNMALLLASSQRHNNVDLQVSGLTYTVYTNVDDEVLSVSALNMQSEPLNPDGTYQVAFNKYNYDTHYDLGGKVDNKRETDETEQEILNDYLAGMDAPIPASLGDVRVSIIRAD